MRLALLLSVALVGCETADMASQNDATDGDDGFASITLGPTDRDLTAGESVYYRPSADGNTFACAHCHALQEPAEDGIRRPGHALGDAAARPSYKNGELDTLLEAVNSCRDEWMNAPTWVEEDPDWSELSAFLASTAPDSAEPLAYEIAQPPVELGGGDPSMGEDLFNGSCAVCHGLSAMGALQGPPLVGATLDAETIARRIRTSGSPASEVYDGLTGGIMPFWAADRLTDDEVRDLVAFVEDAEPVDVDMGDGETFGTAVPCDATHPLVGATATFQERFHDVNGTATILDDCNVEISNFTFDGGGIDVQVYGGLNGSFNAGLSMTENFVGTAFEGGTLIATLPEGATWDDVNSLSIWCVAVGIDFGSAQF